MAITVRVNNTRGNYRVRTIGVAPAGTIEHVIQGGANNLVELSDVDASSVDNNETLVYDESSQKFVVKELPVIKGGTF